MTTLKPLCQQAVFAVMWATALGATTPATSQPQGTGGRCVPVSERAGRELGCFIMVSASLGRLGQAPIYWHIDGYASRAEAAAAKGPRGTVVESLGKVWLFTIA